MELVGDVSVETGGFQVHEEGAQGIECKDAEALGRTCRAGGVGGAQEVLEEPA